MAKIGPLMIDLKSTEIDSEEKEMLRHPACGGVILFARNIESARQVSDLNQQINQLNPALIRAVDQEGGRVQRLKDGFSKLPQLQAIDLATNNNDERRQMLKAHASLMALETRAVGFDISFTPVLDIANEKSRVIADRAFSDNLGRLVDSAKIYINAMSSIGMAATGKHFPGHGTVEADSHVEMPIDLRLFNEIESVDLKPFADLAKLLPAVMTAHVIYQKCDPMPAGFSRFWIQNILREKLKFDGVVFTDDLSMKGAEIVGDFLDRAAAAFEAGCDMALVCNTPNAAGNLLENYANYSNAESARRLQTMKAKGQVINYNELANNAAWKHSRAILETRFEIK